MDAADFEEFFLAFRPRVFGSALAILHDREDARDVTQQVFLKIWHRPEAYRGGNLSGWLGALAKNAALDLVRRRRTRAEIATVPARDRALDNVESEVIGASQRDCIRRAIGELPSRERDLLVASFLEDISHANIARLRSIPLGTVKTRIRSALRRLRSRSEIRSL